MTRRDFFWLAGCGISTGAAAAPVPKDIDPGIQKLLFWRGDRIRVIGPDGTNEADLPGMKDLKSIDFPVIQCPTLSTDGKRLAWIYADPKRGTKLYIREFEGTGAGEFTKEGLTPKKWIGPNELVVRWEVHDPKDKPRWQYHVYDASTGKTKPLEIPSDESPMTVLLDETILSYRSLGFDKVWQRSIGEVLLRRRNGEPKLILKDTESEAFAGAYLSGDGKRVAFFRSNPKVGWPNNQTKWQIFVQMLDGAKPLLIATIPEGSVMNGLAWEPSGRRLAYSTSPYSQPTDEFTSALFIVGSNGGQPKVIAERDPKAIREQSLQLLEWR